MGPRQLPRLIAGALALVLAGAGTAPAGRSFIPIPEIIADPNEGNTVGLLGVMLFTDENDEIQYMLAPDLQYNRTKGVFPTVRFFGYPSPARRYSIVLGKSTTRDEDYEVEFTDRSYWDGRAFLLASALYERDSTERFFGRGNDSSQNAESNYTSNEVLAQATPGVWVLPALNLSYRMRIHRFDIERGQVTSLCFIDAFCKRSDSRGHPERPDRGLEGGIFWAHRVAFTYDTRDARDIPTNGALALVYTEVADRQLGSESSFVKFGGEWRDFIPLRQGNPIVALRALLDYTSGDRQTPFWELNALGGRRTLRGYGSDRFIDFNRSLATAELRTRVYQRRLFGVKAELELAPFLEAGEVFRHVAESPLSDLHWVYGLGFRGVVRPQIVGFVDVGRGREGFAVFTGVDYPF